jgi:hypothetical protein
MNTRKVETFLARFTVAFVALYFPVETFASWRYGLLNPFYIVDLIAMILLGWGALRSLRAAPRRSPAVLCAAYGWTAANAWRSTTLRIYEVRGGARLDYGDTEYWIVIISTLLILACFALSLWLVAQAREETRPQ